MPKSLRTALSVAVVGVFGFVPAVMVASPAQAAPADFLTIAPAGNWEGSAVTFTLTYTGPSVPSPSFDITATGAGTLGVAEGGPVLDPAVPAAPNGDGADFDDNDLASSYFDSPGVETITFPASSPGSPSTATVSVLTNKDADLIDETFVLHAKIGSADVTATGTIWALPSAIPTVSFLAPNTVPESQSTATVTATLSAIQSHDITIPVRVGTAASSPQATSTGGVNRDYTALSSTAAITIPEGQLSGSIAVSLWNDDVYEGGTQYLRVESNGVAPGTQGTAFADIGIIDNDAKPTLSIGDAAPVVEGGASSNPTLYFPVTLSSLSEAAITVRVTTADGTDSGTSHGATGVATADGDVDPDYKIRSASSTPTNEVLIPALNRTVNASVATEGDVLVEGTETMTATLSLSDTTYATLGTPVVATGTITDDDAAGSVTLKTDTGVGRDDEYDEGDIGEVGEYLTLTGDATGSQVPVQIDYSFVDDTATKGSDYRGTSGSFSIPVGTTAYTRQIPVTIIGDRIFDPLETFDVELTSPNGTLADQTFAFTIVDTGDSQPAWTTGNVTVAEGDSGTTMARVPVKLTGPTNVDVKFNADFTTGSPSATEGGISAGTTVGENDYDFPTVRSVTVAAGTTTAYLDIPVNGDAVFENDETFTVLLTPEGTVVSSDTTDVIHSSRVTITNDDAAPAVSFNQLASTEGSTIRVTATTTGLSQYNYKLGFTVAPIGTYPATAGTDYEVMPVTLETATVARGTQGTVFIGTPPTTETTIAEVYLSPDDIDEATETFGVTATETTAALTGIVTTTGTYRISDDPSDLPPTASISDESIKEGDGSVDVTVSLAFTGDTTSSTQDFTLSYYTADGTAEEPADYTETRGTLTIPGGTTSKKINIPIKNDTVVEPDENFFVKIGTPGPTGATLGKSTGEVIIGTGTTPTDPPTDPTDPPTDPTDPPTDPTDPPTDPTDPPADQTISLESAMSYRRGVGEVTLTGTTTPGAMVQPLMQVLGSEGGFLKYKTPIQAHETTGDFSFTGLLTYAGARFAASIMVDEAEVTSDGVTVYLRQNPIFSVRSSSKGTATVTVFGDPRIPGATVRFLEAQRDGSYRTVAMGELSIGGRSVVIIKGLRSGTSHLYKATVYGDGDVGLLTNTSRSARVTIR